MKLTRKNMQIIPESDYGCYVWQLPNGNFLADTEGRLLSMNARRGDISAMAKMNSAAKHYGYPDGEAVWVEAFQCSDEEYEEQVAELNNGKNPNVRIRR